MEEKKPPARGESRETRHEEHERLAALRQLEDWLEGPLTLLSFVWLVLLALELLWAQNRVVELLATVIWIIFIIDFVFRLVLAPRKGEFLKQNWLNAVALFAPALRVFSIFRVARFLRLAQAGQGFSLVRMVASINRVMLHLKKSMQRRGVGYVLAITIIVTLVGSAGMMAFERNAPGQTDFKTYGDALWWTAMIVTTIGSQAWPVTVEGEVLGFLISVFSIGVFGYITASLATYFVGREAEDKNGDLPSAASIEELRREVQALRREIRALAGAGGTLPAPGREE
ncbi:MAG TPA: ion transporter [Bacteroidota bacterium]